MFQARVDLCDDGYEAPASVEGRLSIGAAIGASIAALDQVAAQTRVHGDEAVAMNSSGVDPHG